MKIGFYNPYFDGFGGGERYILTLASYWSKNHEVEIFWDDESIIKDSEERFGLDLSNIKVVHNFFRTNNLLEKAYKSRKYDLIVFLTDGSVPISFAKHNIFHLQVPFNTISMPFWKASHFDAIVCNSEFTKAFTDKRISQKSIVIYPPVDLVKFSSGGKAKIILSVGRFSAHYQAKKQEILLDSFKKGIESGVFRGYSLVLAGGVIPNDRAYFESLKKSVGRFPVTIIPNCTFSELQRLYARSSIYWHAAGFGETNPMNMEHFGISTVEAMKSGCVPIVYAAGGQPEIVSDGINGYLWYTTNELIEKTVSIIRDDQLRKTIAANARVKSGDYSVERFCQSFDRLIERL